VGTVAKTHLDDVRLAGCSGFLVAVGQRPVGSAETLIFGGSSIEPDFLLVRTAEAIPGTFRAIPASLIEEIDATGRLITLAASWDEIAALPEQVPLERRYAPRAKEDPCK
jgi:hypothetical protein